MIKHRRLINTVFCYWVLFGKGGFCHDFVLGGLFGVLYMSIMRVIFIIRSLFVVLI